VLRSLLGEHKDRQIDVAIGDLPEADADPQLVRQVWVNLIANALKYSKGRDTAVIRVGSETTGGVPVYHVQDNGVGFDMRYAHKLFGVFQRLHRAEDYEGTGVGLAIVQRIIARHGGRIWAQAVKNQGATFYFTLQGAQDHV
jgi:light-regulated signal transduction histidine kinase (bacteriophytochrome)